MPSLLPGIALVYLFGNQGMLKELLMGESIYGPIGIVIGSVFFTFPHAMIIILTALSISDARLYEAAVSLRRQQLADLLDRHHSRRALRPDLAPPSWSSTW